MYSQPLLIAALLWAAHALPTEEQAGIVRFPLKRVPHSAATVERRQDTVPIPNSDVFAYLLAVKIGTPGADISLLPDITSADTWVNPNCDAAGTLYTTSCPHGFYNPGLSSSKTFTNLAMNWQHVYSQWSGTAVGTYLKDTFTIGSVTLTQAQFGLNTRSLSSGPASYGFPFGILGLSFGNGYNNIVDEFKLQGKINSRLFALSIGAASPVGEIVFGGIDTKKYIGPLTAVPIIYPGPDGSKRYWVGLTAIGKTVSSVTSTWTSANQLVLDSSAGYSFLPAGLLDILIRNIYPGGSYSISGDVYEVPCSVASQPGTINFDFGGRVIAIPYGAMIAGHGGTCFLNAKTVQPGSLPILSGGFLQAVYAVFDQDYKSVYLAPFSDCGSAIVAVPNAAGAPLLPQFVGQCGTQITTTSSATKFYTVPPTCSTNRCLGAMSNPAKITMASSFCNSFLKTSVPAQSTNVVPSYLTSVCSSKSRISSVSSGCQCFLAQYTGPPLK